MANLTSGNDTWTSSSVSETIFGLSGADTMYGGDDDIIYGNIGNDTLYLSETSYYGTGILYGGQNGGDVKTYNDAGGGRLAFRDGTEYLFGGTGLDIIYGNMGDDYLRGFAHADTLYGGQDDDTIIGDRGADKLYGNKGNDFIIAGAGNNTDYTTPGTDGSAMPYGTDIYEKVIDGGFGNDTIIGTMRDGYSFYQNYYEVDENVKDTVYVGSGDDVIRNFAPKGSTVIMSGGSGSSFGVTETDVLMVPSGLTWTITEDSDSYDVAFSNGASVSIEKTFTFTETNQTLTLSGDISSAFEYFI